MQIQITIVDMKLLKTIYKGIDWFIRNGLDISSVETLAHRKKEWEWMEEEEKKKQQKQNDLGGPNGHLGV